MSLPPQIAEVMARLKVDFITASLERLDELDRLIGGMYAFDGRFEDQLQELQRHVHSMKGEGSSFGFTSVTILSHGIEDYLEACANVQAYELRTVTRLLDRIRQVVESGEDVPEDQAHAWIDTLVTARAKAISEQDRRVVDLLLVMPPSLQRKIIAQELASCGFQVRTSESPISALETCLRNCPSYVLATQEMDTMTGVELAQVLAALDRTRSARFVLMAVPETIDDLGRRLPSPARAVRKGPNFAEDLMAVLVDWGFFGRVGQAGAA